MYSVLNGLIEMLTANEKQKVTRQVKKKDTINIIRINLLLTSLGLNNNTHES